MPNYAVQFDNAENATGPLWNSGTGISTVVIECVMGALVDTDGVVGMDTSTESFFAVYADGHFKVRFDNAGSTHDYDSATGLLAAATKYKLTLNRTSTTTCNIHLQDYADATIMQTNFAVPSASVFKFDSVGATSTLFFDGLVERIQTTGGTNDRDYYSTVNTGTVWTDSISAQNFTLGAGLTWVLITGTTAGILSLAGLVNNTGTSLANVSGIDFDVINNSTGASVKRFTGLLVDGSGNLAISDPLIIVGTSYYVVCLQSATSRGVSELITAV